MTTKTFTTNHLFILFYVFFMVLFLGGQAALFSQCETGLFFDPNEESRGADRVYILEKYEDYNSNSNLYDRDSTKTESRVIPVVFHIIHQCGIENIGIEQCRAALEEANADFQGNNIELNYFEKMIPPFTEDIGFFTNFHFELATKDPYGNATTGITRTLNELTYFAPDGPLGDQLKQTIQWDPTKYLNVWVVKSTGGSAYAYYPSNVVSAPYRDGIVISHNYLGVTGTSTVHRSHNRRHTLAHEFGHWLGLQHTWGVSNDVGIDSNCSDDDDLCDTPNVKGNSEITFPSDIPFVYNNGLDTIVFEGFTGSVLNSCPQSTEDCGGDGSGERVDNRYNLMDYGSAFVLTKEQIKLMIATLNTFVAGRDQIGTLAAQLEAFLPKVGDEYVHAAITVDSYDLIQVDANNTPLTNGITIALSEGRFRGTDFIASITPDLSTQYNLNYNIDFIDDQHAQLFFTGDFAAIPPNGLDNISISIDLNQIEGNQKPFYRTSISGLKINRDNSAQVVENLALQHTYLNIFDRDNGGDGRLCLDENSPRNGRVEASYNFQIGNAVTDIGVKYINYGTASGPLLDEGFYLFMNRGAALLGNIEILVNNTDEGEGNVPLLPRNFDLISEDYDNNPASLYKYAPLTIATANNNTNQEIYGMARLYSNNFPDNLDKEGYVGFRYRVGCEANWFYAWMKISVKEENQIPTMCLIEAQAENKPHTDNSSDDYLVGVQEGCDNPEPKGSYVWIDEVRLNNQLLSDGEGDTGYKDYTSFGAQTTLDVGGSYPINLTLRSPVTNDNTDSAIFAFIDFNEPNGTFDYSEVVLLEKINFSNGLYEFSGSVTVPRGITTGDYKMRVIHSFWPYNNNMTNYYLNPCSPIDYGEVEDYLISITGDSPEPPVNPPTEVCQTEVRFRSNDFIRLHGIQLTNLVNDNRDAPRNDNDWEGYTDFTNLPPANLLTDGNPILRATDYTIGGQRWIVTYQVWIDDNDDGQFTGNTELVGQYRSTQTQNPQVLNTHNIPLNIRRISDGIHRMRVIACMPGFSQDSSACDGFIPLGEVEDYRVNIGTSGGENIEEFACPIESTSPFPFIGIESIQQGTFITPIHNEENNPSRYFDFTDVDGLSFAKGVEEELTLNTYVANTSYRQYWQIWVDFNKDGRFATVQGCEERLTYGNDIVPPAETTIPINFTVKDSVELGEYKMRVVLSLFPLGPNGCTDVTYGEIHDYNLQLINPSTAPQGPITDEIVEETGEQGSPENPTPETPEEEIAEGTGGQGSTESPTPETPEEEVVEGTPEEDELDDIEIVENIHRIPLKKGLNYISSYLIPENLDMEAIFEQEMSSNNLIQVFNANGVYLGDGARGAKTWDAGSAYFVNVNNPSTLLIEGEPYRENRTSIKLNAGWNDMTYPYNYPMKVKDFFAGCLEDIEVVKSPNFPNLAYVNDLEEMTIGEEMKMYPNSGYKIKSKSNLVVPLSPEVKDEVESYEQPDFNTTLETALLIIYANEYTNSILDNGGDFSVRNSKNEVVAEHKVVDNNLIFFLKGTNKQTEPNRLENNEPIYVYANDETTPLNLKIIRGGGMFANNALIFTRVQIP